MKNKFYKNKRGITLIALVITIIVLLILAGVAISMLSGENGILNQAADAKTETERTSKEENLKIAYLTTLTEGLGKVDALKLQTELEKTYGTGNVTVTKDETTGDFTIDTTEGEVEESYKISKDGELSKIIATTPQEPTTISFTIDGTLYTCEEGTTWNELVSEGIIPTKYSVRDWSWVYKEEEFENDNLTYYSVAEGIIFFEGTDGDGYGSCFVFAPDGYAVLGNDEVINGGDYTDSVYNEHANVIGCPDSYIRPGVELIAK